MSVPQKSKKPFYMGTWAIMPAERDGMIKLYKTKMKRCECWGSHLLRLNSEAPTVSFFSRDHPPLTSEGEGKPKLGAAEPNVTASVRGETRRESSLQALMERLKNQAITACCTDIKTVCLFVFLNIRDTGQCQNLLFSCHVGLRFLHIPV